MDRILLTVGIVVVCLLSFAALWVGWRHRLARQGSALSIPGLPAVPEDLGPDLSTPLSGLYVSSTPAGKWQDRLVVHGLGRRARVTVHRHRAGVLLDRVGEEPIFIPADSLDGVRTAPGIAGKVMGMEQGILVLTWRLGGIEVDSGIRADDLQIQREWLAAPGSTGPGRGTDPDPTDRKRMEATGD